MDFQIHLIQDLHPLVVSFFPVPFARILSELDQLLASNPDIKQNFMICNHEPSPRYRTIIKYQLSQPRRWSYEKTIDQNQDFVLQPAFAKLIVVKCGASGCNRVWRTDHHNAIGYTDFYGNNLYILYEMKSIWYDKL